MNLNDLPEELRPLYTKLRNSSDVQEILLTALSLVEETKKLPRKQQEQVRELLRQVPKLNFRKENKD